MAKEMTREQYKEIRRLTRAAQRRMERASEGQRRAMEYQVQKATGSKKWSSATKGFSYQQAQAQIEKLSRFMEAETTTIRGWRAIKTQQVSKAAQTLAERYSGFNLTDAELADIFKQVGDKSRQEKYKAINLVVASKAKQGELPGQLSSDEISKAIAEKVSYEAAYRRALRARKRLAQEDFSKYMSDADFDIPFLYHQHIFL